MRISRRDLILDNDYERKEKAEDASKKSDELLLESIKNVGLNEPLVIAKEGDKFKLVDGYRRVRVLDKLHSINRLPEGLDINSLPAIEIKEDISPLRARLESDIRQDLKPTERAFFLKKLTKEFGMKRKEIARMFGWSTPSVANWLIILDCIEQVKDGIDEGRFPMSAGKIFGVMKERGQQILFRRVKKLKKVKRETLRTQATKIPDKYFKKPYEERMDITQSVRKAKKGYIHKDRTVLKVREVEKRLLKDDISVQEKELFLLERDRDGYSRLLRKHAYQIEVWFRTKVVKDYVQKKYPKTFNQLQDIIDIELGIKM